MAFQQYVRRNYTTGFPGDIVRDGPQRAKPGRIVSANNGANTNTISRVFGFNADMSLSGHTDTRPVPPGTGALPTLGAQNFEVALGGTNFYGILGHTKHYALYGNVSGPLGASIVLPQYSEGEFFDMVTGLVVEIFNPTAGTQTVNYGDELYYVTSATTAEDNPNAIPVGALVAFAPGATVPDSFGAVPGGIVIDPTALAASSPTVQASTYTIVQLTR